MTFDDWIRDGIDAGYCGPPICETHDGTPLTDLEEQQFDDGADPCIPMIRLYHDTAERAAVEAAHPPSQWRKAGL